jgi:hypothetical protein
MQQNSILGVLAQRIPPNPHQSCPFISTQSNISCNRLLSITKEQEQEALVTVQQSPLYSFMYALKSSEARRQYPKRLKMLFDYLKLQGSLGEQAKHFLDNARQQGIQWAQDNIMIFLDFHKERVRKKELGAGTLKNYYRAAKLFCEMNDLTINWRRISKGLYYTDKVQTRLDDGIAEVPFAAILTEREKGTITSDEYGDITIQNITGILKDRFGGQPDRL